LTKYENRTEQRMSVAEMRMLRWSKEVEKLEKEKGGEGLKS